MNYEGSLVYINQAINTLKISVQLDLDGALFRDKIVADIRFLDDTIQSIYRRVLDNRQLIQRDAVLQSLKRAKQNFQELLEDIFVYHTKKSFFPNQTIESFKKIHERNLDDMDEIESILKGFDDDNMALELVSAEEINLLLMPADIEFNS